jgi:hypothetical protein
MTRIDERDSPNTCNTVRLDKKYPLAGVYIHTHPVFMEINRILVAHEVAT